MGCCGGGGAPAGTVYKITAVVDGQKTILGYEDTRDRAAVIRANQADVLVRTSVRITQAPRSEMEAWQAEQNAA